MKRKAFIFSSSVLFWSGCHGRSPSGHFVELRAGGEPLRTAFNREAGKVRVVMLVSPT